MCHRLAQILGARLPPVLSGREIARYAIVLHDSRMIHGKVGGVSLEFSAHGIASIAHHFIDQFVSLLDGLGRLIHEVTLAEPPSVGKPFLLNRRQLPYGIALYPLGALFQFGFCSSTVADRSHCALILRTETPVQGLGASLLN